MMFREATAKKWIDYCRMNFEKNYGKKNDQNMTDQSLQRFIKFSIPL